MPNGKSFAQCGECINFTIGTRPHCKKHKFDFPTILIGYEFLCKDYTPAHDYSEKPDVRIKNLGIGYLFYYCCQGKRGYKKLQSFAELYGPIYGVHLLEDEHYKWLFRVENYYKDLWDEKEIALRYNNREENFIQQKLTKEIFTSYTPSSNKVLYTPQLINVFVPQDKNSNLLNSFVDNFIGLSSYNKKKKLNEETMFFGISVFLKKSKDIAYEISPDLYFKDSFLNPEDSERREDDGDGSIFRNRKAKPQL